MRSIKVSDCSIRGRRFFIGAALAISGIVASQSVAHADVWWPNYATNQVGHANTDGTSVNNSFIAARTMTSGVAVDATYVYWANGMYTTPGSIGRALRNGTNPDNDFVAQSNFPNTGIGGLAVNSSHIYFSEPNNGSIGRANIDGTGVTHTLVSGLGYLYGIAIDANYIYWADQSNNSIGRANLDGSNVNRNFITGANDPLSVAVNATHVFWQNWPDSTIGRASINGSNVNQSFITVSGGGIVGVAVDANYIYWSPQYSTYMGRANLDGTGINNSFINTGNDSYILAVDQPVVTTTTTTSTTVAPTTTTVPASTSTTSTSSSTTSSSTSSTTTVAPISGMATLATVPQKAIARVQATPTTISTSTTSTAPVTSTTTPLAVPQIPDAAPGSASMLTNGTPEQVAVARVDNSLQVSSPDVNATFTAESPDGSLIPLDNDGQLRLQSGDIISVDATGLVADTEVQVWMNSTPTLLDTVTVDASGHISGKFTIPSSSTKGNHRFSLVGNSRSGSTTLTVGFVVGTLKSGGFSGLLLIPITLAAIVAITLPNQIRRRRKKSPVA